MSFTHDLDSKRIYTELFKYHAKHVPTRGGTVEESFPCVGNEGVVALSEKNLKPTIKVTKTPSAFY